MWFVQVCISLNFAAVVAVDMPKATMPDLSMSRNDREQWCRNMNAKYDIIPGESFGKLTNMYHKGYLRMNCDEFFCKPHPQRGRGSYKCEPL
jgi:hypothetical protein